MAITRIGGANAITGTIPQGNIANASLGAVTALPAAISTGKVLQVLTFTVNSAETTNSNTFTATALLKAITPSSSSNKIFVVASGVIQSSGAATNSVITLYRDSTNLGTASSGMASQYGSGGGGSCNFGMNYLDSPSTTSEVIYKVYFKANSGSHNQVIFTDNSVGSITVMEIAA
tara:strand:- start:105 stop:629 length:525 start_codon:yes stop_codon:yes gene_type:complete